MKYEVISYEAEDDTKVLTPEQHQLKDMKKQMRKLREDNEALRQLELARRRVEKHSVDAHTGDD